MDLISTLKKKIAILDDGDYIIGLKAVLLHIETAFRHLSRGQDTEDETAFTDAIYRTNQAFEGSLKEAYRVLADKDPHKSTPFDIEEFLIKSKTFRSRVLTQLKNYRTEWRNPSTHDYKLDFDVSEAFLAIVSVSAFACLLLDEIAEVLAFKKTQAESEAQKSNKSLFATAAKTTKLLPLTVELLKAFCASTLLPTTTATNRPNENQLLGALHGFLAYASPGLKIETDVELAGTSNIKADLLISKDDEQVIIEVKRFSKYRSYANGTVQLDNLMQYSKIKNGILLIPPTVASEMTETTRSNLFGGKMVLLQPSSGWDQ